MSMIQAFTVLKKNGRRNIQRLIETAPVGHGGFYLKAFKTIQPAFNLETYGARTVAYFLNANYQEIESSLSMKCR